jgi:general secretion pathway protein C
MDPAPATSPTPPLPPTPPTPSATEATRNVPPESTDARAEREARALEEAARSIREISPTEHAIPRKALDALFDNRDALLRAGRLVPEQQDGGPVGFRLFGVRKDGLLGRLGFENGDRLERVLGKPFTTAEQALEIFSAAQKARIFDVDLARRGAPVRLIVRVDP